MFRLIQEIVQPKLNFSISIKNRWLVVRKSGEKELKEYPLLLI